MMKTKVWLTRTIQAGVGASVALASLLVAPPGADGAVGFGTPQNVVARAAYGAIKISWTKASVKGVTYNVVSSPAGKSCVVVDAASCLVPVTDSTPWRFSVSASQGGRVAAESPLTATVPTRVVLLVAGQSNATGLESYAQDPVSGINYMAGNYLNGADAGDHIMWLPWPTAAASQPGWVPLDSPQRRKPDCVHVIFGPEIGLARQIWADTGRSVDVYKATYPGSFLAGNWSPTNKKGLFVPMVRGISAQMKIDAAYGQLDVLGGFYWFQGEADAEYPAAASIYAGNLTTMLTALRSQLPMATAPIGLAKIDLTSVAQADYASGRITADRRDSMLAGAAQVRAADDLVASQLPFVMTADSAGMPRTDGLIHLTNESELAIGAALAKATESLLP